MQTDSDNLTKEFLVRLARYHVGRRLHQFDQHAFTRQRRCGIALGMDEADVVTRGALADAARREAHALLAQPLHRGREIVDPQADVVEARLVDLRALRHVDRFHQIDLDAGDREDVLVDVLALAAELALLLDAEQVDPQMAQRRLRRRTDRDLLQAEDAERPSHFAFRTSSSVRSPGRGALTRIDMLPFGCLFSRISWWHSPVSRKPNTRDMHGSTLPSMPSLLPPCACSSFATCEPCSRFWRIQWKRR